MISCGHSHVWPNFEKIPKAFILRGLPLLSKTSNVIRTSNLVNPGCYAAIAGSLSDSKVMPRVYGCYRTSPHVSVKETNELVKSMNRMEARLVTK